MKIGFTYKTRGVIHEETAVLVLSILFLLNILEFCIVMGETEYSNGHVEDISDDYN